MPYVFSLFMFILFANLLGMLPLGLVGVHPFTFTSHFTATGVLAIQLRDRADRRLRASTAALLLAVRAARHAG